MARLADEGVEVRVQFMAVDGFHLHTAVAALRPIAPVFGNWLVPDRRRGPAHGGGLPLGIGGRSSVYLIVVTGV